MPPQQQALNVVRNYYIAFMISTGLKIFLLTLLLSSCGSIELYHSNYNFECNATYSAPHLQATAFVYAKGYVPEGADIADDKGILDINIVFHKKYYDTLKIKSSDYNISKVFIGQKDIPISDSGDYYKTLVDCIQTIGIKNIDTVELEEFARVIVSPSAGPKGTFLKGQPKHIIVDTVFYKIYDK